jgi:hypothetical protein
VTKHLVKDGEPKYLAVSGLTPGISGIETLWNIFLENERELVLHDVNRLFISLYKGDFTRKVKVGLKKEFLNSFFTR